LSWTVESLQGLEPGSLEWEMERARIIRAYIQSLPEERRKKALAQQLLIDCKQLELSPAEFNAWLWAELNENLQNLEDQLRYLKRKLDLSS